jgi:hypothetical protein
MARVYWTAVALFIVAAAMFYVGIASGDWFGGSFWAWGVSVVVLACVGITVRLLGSRRAPSVVASALRLVTTAWLTGVGAAVLAVVAYASVR